MPGNIDLFRAIIERGFNIGDLSVADEVCADRVVEHQYLTPTNLSGPEILKTQIRNARLEVTDLRLVIEEVVEAGEKVWARMKATGKARNGKNVAMHVFDVCRFENGKLVEHWGVPDRFALLHQAGLIPSRPVS